MSSNNGLIYFDEASEVPPEVYRLTVATLRKALQPIKQTVTEDDTRLIVTRGWFENMNEALVMDGQQTLHEECFIFHKPILPAMYLPAPWNNRYFRRHPEKVFARESRNKPK